MDGGKHILALAPVADRPETPLGDWAGRLAVRAEVPSPAVQQHGWAAKLAAHARQAGGLRAAVASPRPAPAEAAPIGAFLEALNLLKEQLLRERGRADAAEACLAEAREALAGREAALAAADMRLAEATRRAERAEKEAQAAQQGLRRLRGRGLIARILNAD